MTWVFSAGIASGGLAAGETGTGRDESLAAAPTEISVTLYRAPTRNSGAIDLDDLAGFALISETRTVNLASGETRLRFEGVADGIEPASAIVTGLGEGILEKNRDAALLSPAALIAAAAGKGVVLVRTDPKTGKVERLPGSVLADAEGGVVFRTEQGIEALRCSGLPETFSFDGAAGLRSRPTLSVRVRSRKAITARATLSYLASGFDWAADYTATVAADEKSMDLGAWVTLANGNGVGFADAHAQVVAGRVNHESGHVEPIDQGAPILALCWPRGSTSDHPERAPIMYLARLGSESAMRKGALPMAAPALQEIAVSAMRVTQEQLGDLKLYRVPERTTLAARQSKQVRLLDRSRIPIEPVYSTELWANADAALTSAEKLLRTRNDAAHHLGLPLPSGHIVVFGVSGTERLLEHESDLSDLAIGEAVEIEMGPAPDVQVASIREGDSHRIEITNAREGQIDFELKLRVPESMRIVNTDRALALRNGRPLLLLKVPASSAVSFRYRTQHARA